MKKHAGLKVLTAAVVFVVVLILMNGSHQEKVAVKSDPNNLNEAIASQFNDNIREVAARLQETEKKLEQLSQENATLKKAHSSPKVSRDNNKALLEEIERIKGQLANLQKSPKTSDTENYVIQETKHDLDETPIKQDGSKKSTTSSQIKNPLMQNKVATKPRPFYTIPAGSDLGHTTLLSALIGEVPVEGKLMQPLFPFSAIINRGDLMAANGIPLPPQISGMKIAGYAIGVGSFLDNISCVRAYVTSALFVFDDGHFVTVGKEQMNGTTEMINNDSIGYLTTAYGNPCIKGQYITNAPRVLTAMMAADGVKGIGSALSQWQMTYSANANGTSGTPTGSMGNYALGGALSQSSMKGADWLEKRIQGSFDMVFVPASIGTSHGYHPNQLSLHITQTIKIDKKFNGRVLDYGHLQQITHDFNL